MLRPSFDGFCQECAGGLIIIKRPAKVNSSKNSRLFLATKVHKGSQRKKDNKNQKFPEFSFWPNCRQNKKIFQNFRANTEVP